MVGREILDSKALALHHLLAAFFFQSHAKATEVAPDDGKCPPLNRAWPMLHMHGIRAMSWG
jgi:hypothetical protein